MSHSTACLLLLAACGAIPTGDDLTRGEAYAIVRPEACDRLARCAPRQFARDFADQDACIAAARPHFPRSAEKSPCSRTQAETCVSALETEPCAPGHPAACNGC